MKTFMKKKLLLISLLLCFIVFICGYPSPAQPQISKNPPEGRVAEIMARVNHNFLKIKDAVMDLKLDYILFLFGCSGRQRLEGKGYYKSPDKIKAVVNDATYYVRGNQIRKIDENGKKYYVKLLHSLDFSPGFHAGLIPHNFFLTLTKDEPDQIILEGIPKPGVLKNVTKVIFYVDPKEYLLRELDIILVNKNLSGRIKIDYQKINDLWVPIGCYGTSAIEIRNNALVGMGIRLKGENTKINIDLSDHLFDPGF